jgi:hypothetical protein
MRRLSHLVVMALMCRNKDLLSKCALARANFVSKMRMARSKERAICSRESGITAQNAVHTMRPAMAIKLLCKLMHEIERALSKECQG